MAEATTPSSAAEAGAALTLEGFTLCVPALGIGNVCQLALDCLVSTLLRTTDSGIEHCGHFSSAALRAVIGSDPYLGTKGHVSRSADIYVLRKAKVAFLVVRAFAHKGQHELFVQHVVDFARSVGVAKILLLSGVDAAFTPECMMEVAAGAPTQCRVATLSAIQLPPSAVADGAKISPVHAVDGAAVAAGATPLLHAVGSEIAASCGEAWASSSEIPESPSLDAVARMYDGGSHHAPAIGLGEDSSAAPAVPGWRSIESKRAQRLTGALFGGGLWGTGYTPCFVRRVLNDLDAEAPAPAAGASGSKVPSLTALLAFTHAGEGNIAYAAEFAHLVSLYLGIEPTLRGGGPAAPSAAAVVSPGRGGKAKTAAAAATGPLEVKTASGLVFVLPAYFRHLAGPPPDLTTGMYGF